eukprot:3908182-Rhodomonas_salina.6
MRWATWWPTATQVHIRPRARCAMPGTDIACAASKRRLRTRSKAGTCRCQVTKLSAVSEVIEQWTYGVCPYMYLYALVPVCDTPFGYAMTGANLRAECCQAMSQNRFHRKRRDSLGAPYYCLSVRYAMSGTDTAYGATRIDKSYMRLTSRCAATRAFEVPNVLLCCYGNDQVCTYAHYLVHARAASCAHLPNSAATRRYSKMVMLPDEDCTPAPRRPAGAFSTLVDG